MDAPEPEGPPSKFQKVTHWGTRCEISGQEPIEGKRYTKWEKRARRPGSSSDKKGVCIDICEAEYLKLPPHEQAGYEEVEPDCFWPGHEPPPAAEPIARRVVTFDPNVVEVPVQTENGLPLDPTERELRADQQGKRRRELRRESERVAADAEAAKKAEAEAAATKRVLTQAQMAAEEEAEADAAQAAAAAKAEADPPPALTARKEEIISFLRKLIATGDQSTLTVKQICTKLKEEFTWQAGRDFDKV